MNSVPRRKKVLVTGGAGFVGSHLVEALLAAGHLVRVFDDLSTGCSANLRPNACMEFIIGDVRDRAALERPAMDCDIAFHLAGIVGMRLAHQMAGDSYEIADLGTANVLSVTGDCPCVLLSSSSVYGLRTSKICRESDDISLESALAYDGGHCGYACGKLALERHGEAAARQGREIFIVRPFNVVGPRQLSDYGMVLPTFVESALAGADLPVYGDGSQGRCFSDVTVFVRSLLALVGHHRPSGRSPLFLNNGCSNPTTILELAKAVLRAVPGHAAIRYLPFERDFPGRTDVQLRIPCTRRLEGLIGKVHWPGIDTIIQRLLDFGTGK